MTDSRESDCRAIVNRTRVRQESDARHQEKFDRDSLLSCIVPELGADASRAFGDAARRSKARLRRLDAACAASAFVLGDTQKTMPPTQCGACGRSARARVAAVSR
jgi:RecB family exonuclease